MWSVKRRCVGSVSVEAFDLFSQGGDLNKFEMKNFMAQKGLWNLVREKVLRER